MWQLINRTPYAADRTWIRDRDGHHHWVVAVKATYDLLDSSPPRLAARQESLLLIPTYLGEPGASSLYQEIDLGPCKPTTDVLLHGYAYTPGGRQATSVDVSLHVGPVRKTLRVFGSRSYQQGIIGVVAGKPEPFQRCPLIYEWAYGGYDATSADPRSHRMDPRNPVGKGVAAAGRLLGCPAHRIEYPDGRTDASGPAGFGPIGAEWSPRREFAGTFDAQWDRKRRPLLPADYDERHRQCAPLDQQTPRPLVGGEPVDLHGMTPGGRMAFELPRMRLTFLTRFGSERRSHTATLATVSIEPELARLVLVWQTSLPVAARDTDQLDTTLIQSGAY